MGMTIVEKILARASGRETVSPGEFIEVTPIPVTVINPSSMEGRVRPTLEWGKPLLFADRVLKKEPGARRFDSADELTRAIDAACRP